MSSRHARALPFHHAHRCVRCSRAYGTSARQPGLCRACLDIVKPKRKTSCRTCGTVVWTRSKTAPRCRSCDAIQHRRWTGTRVQIT